MSSQQNPNSSLKSLSFDDISKHFSSPLADAAADLGVCATVLKRICRENGLDRWPYRKVLSGKSVEDIKRLAARKKKKEVFVMQMISKKSGSENQSSETSKQAVAPPRNLQQQNQCGPGGVSGGLAKGSAVLDEFKNGFPSDGLTVASNKWWGSNNYSGDEAESKGGNEHGKSEDMGDIPMEVVETENENCRMDSIETNSLSSLRKRAVLEGREALKLKVFKGHPGHDIGEKERNLLVQIFHSSLPKKWMGGSF